MTTDHLSILSDPQSPLPLRFRALFALKSVGGPDASLDIGQALLKSLDNVLLCHEMAYVLGQIGNPIVIPILSDVLRNEGIDSMIRHEAAEALGAIGSKESIPVLTEFSTHSTLEISQTCQLALDLIKHLSLNPKMSRKYNSVDPAPPLESNDIQQLGEELMDSNKSLFRRYRCMFSLRDIGTDDAVKVSFSSKS
jgi:deoxyhypusine monooxygenase